MSEVMPYVGAAVGFVVSGFNVAGAQWGFAIGSAVGALTAEKPHIQGPRLDDLQVVGTDYGQSIPWVAGSPRLAPQYIWLSPVREIANTTKQGKGGGAKSTTYTYEVDVVLMVSENTTEDAVRHWVNSELVAAVVPGTPDAEDIAAGSAEAIDSLRFLSKTPGKWRSLTVCRGLPDQMPHPIYEAAVGAGNAPAYRGRTTIVLEALQLGNGKALPNLEHQITKGFGGTSLVLRSAMDFRAPGVRTFDAPWPSQPLLWQQTFEVEDVFDPDIVWKIQALGSDPLTPTSDLQKNPSGVVAGQLYLESYGKTRTGSFAFMSTPGGAKFSLPGDFTIAFQYTRTADDVWADGSGEVFHFCCSTAPGSLGEGGWWFRSVISPETLQRVLEFSFRISATTQEISAAHKPEVGVRNTYVATRSGNLVSLYINGALVASDTGAGWAGATSAASPVSVGTSGGGFQQIPNEYATGLYDRMLIADGVDPSGEYETLSSRLDLVLRALMDRAGYFPNEFDIEVFEDRFLSGYATTQVTGTRAHIEMLQPYGLYESSCSDKIYIRRRATEPLAAIPWGELGASESPNDPGDPFPLKMRNELEAPAQIAVRYRNVLADWNTGTEFSDRYHSSVTSTTTVDQAYGLTPSEAKTISQVMLKDIMAGMGSATLRLAGRKYARYEPGDVLTTQAPDGTAYRFRIVGKRDMVFLLEWSVVLDDAAALEGDGVTDEDYVSIAVPPRQARTDWEVIAIPPLLDADASAPGPYVAVTPHMTQSTDVWPGAVFARARLPEAFEEVFVTGVRATLGECTSTLADFEQGSTVLDWGQKLYVKVFGELESAEFYDFFQDRTINAAVVGDEPIRFLRAEFLGMDGQMSEFALSGLMRGQLGQELQISEHAAGERFVLLNTAVRRMVNVVTDIGQTHQVKAVTLNQYFDSVTDEDFTDDGIALRPYSPVALRGEWQENGDLAVAWVRRSRLVARYTDAGVFAPLGELNEAYRVRVFDDPDVAAVRSADTASPEWTYSAADIASDGFSSGDTITIEPRQLSDIVGEGFAATLEVQVP